MNAWTIGSLLAIGFVQTAGAGCVGSPVAEYRMTPSLKAAEANTSYRVVIFDSRCVLAEFPKQDIRRGSVTATLGKNEYSALLDQIRASGVATLDTAALQKELTERNAERAKSPEAYTLWASTDGDIIEFEFSSRVNKSRPHHVTWSTLHQDLLNHPNHQKLNSLQALQQVFTDLSDQVVSRSQEIQQ